MSRILSRPAMRGPRGPQCLEAADGTIDAPDIGLGSNLQSEVERLREVRH